MTPAGFAAPAHAPAVNAAKSAVADAAWQALLQGQYTPLTPEGILAFCSSQLQGMDTAIQKNMNKQSSLVKLQDQVAGIQNALKAHASGTGKESDYAFNDQAAVDGVTAKIDAAIGSAKEAGNNQLVADLEAVKVKLRDGEDGSVSFGEVKDMSQMLDNANAACRSGAELNMIELQALISKRSTALQLITGMMNNINEIAKTIAGNIR